MLGIVDVGPGTSSDLASKFHPGTFRAEMPMVLVNGLAVQAIDQHDNQGEVSRDWTSGYQ